jgi:hypothetical protein
LHWSFIVHPKNTPATGAVADFCLIPAAPPGESFQLAHFYDFSVENDGSTRATKLGIAATRGRVTV